MITLVSLSRLYRIRLFIYLYADLNDSGATLFGRIVALLIKAVLPELALTTNSALDTAINSNKAYF